MTTKTAMTGAALALVAAGLFASIPTQVVAEEASTVQCFGVNACKGQNDCKTAKNECKGKGSCKGLGFKNMTLAECNAAGGKVGSKE
ncbi:MAG: BufA2 family periplasmic bufferin-type metallophore [Pseudomonas sp.]